MKCSSSIVLAMRDASLVQQGRKKIFVVVSIKGQEITMTCITHQHVGKYTSLYESTSYRDKQGKPKNKKVRLEKLDPETR